MNRMLCIFLFMLFHWHISGQADLLLNIPEHALSWHDPVSNIDSLKKLFPSSTGVEKVDFLCEIAYAMHRLQPRNTASRKYIDEALKLSESLDYQNGMLKANFLLANYYWFTKRDAAAALEFFKKAESLFDHETHWIMKYRVWQNICRIYGSRNEREAVAFYYQKMFDHLHEPDAWPARFSVHIGLMRNASLAGDFVKQRKHIEKAIELFRQHNQDGIFTALRLLNEVEELSIHLANYGEYRRAVELMNEVLNSIPDHEKADAYSQFYKAKIYGRIARIYRHWGKYDTALVYFSKAFDGFTKFYNEQHSAMIAPGVYPSKRLWSINYANQFEEQAIVLIKKGNLSQAEDDLRRSISIRTEYNDPLGVGMCYDRMGEIYSIRGSFQEALQWFDSALIIKKDFLTEELKKTHGASALKLLFGNESLAATYLKTGRLYQSWNSPVLAREYFNRSHAMSVEAGSHKAEAEALTALGDLFLSFNDTDSALTYYQQAKNIYEKMENKPGLAAIYESLGDMFKSKGRFDAAFENYDFSLQIYTGLEMPAHLAPLMIKQGDNLMLLPEHGKAIESYKTALEIAAGYDLRKTMMNAHNRLSDVFSLNGDIEKAFVHFKSYVGLRDEMFNLEARRHIAEMETRFEAEQNRNMIRLLQAEKELSEDKEARNRLIIVLLAGFILLLLLWVLLYVRHTRLKNSNEMMRIQQKLFRSQMNPHFIFNSLGSIQSSIMNDQPIEAVKYLSRFSKLMRKILESSHAENVQLAKELATIENYLELQRIRFPEKFEYSITVDDQLNIENIYIPPMLAQPFIENAIEHGIRQMKSKGHIGVGFRKENKRLIMEIEDNGIGREKALQLLKRQNVEHKSLATDIIRERIAVLNRNQKRKIAFEIIDLKDEQGEARGTRVVFGVPV